MNSDKKVCEELLKYHPEFKDSKKDISEVISHLQSINPDIKINQVFADKLKERIISIADYQDEKKKSKFSIFTFLIPVFSFWFAVFGFWYLSDDVISPWNDLNNVNMPAPAMMKMPSQETRMMIQWDMMMNTDNWWDVSSDDMVQQDEDITDNRWLEDGYAEMQMFMMDDFTEDIEDEFLLTCEDSQWEVSILSDWSRVCTLRETTCLESDYFNNNCEFISE